MKTIVISFTAFVAAFIQAQEFPDLEPLPVTNNIRSPLILKGIYGTRNQGSVSSDCKMENVVMDTLRLFKKTQNEDGSWGTEENRCLATSLVLISLLGHGERSSSMNFGETVSRAHKYMLTCNPTNDPERICLIIALSEYVAWHTRSMERDRVKVEISRINALLATVQNTTNSPWVDYLTFYLLPPEITRPDWIKYTREFSKRWSNINVNVEPITLDEFLVLRIAGLARFRTGGKVWDAFHRQFISKIVERERPDGFYPSRPEYDRFACTALAVQMMGVYYAFLPNSSMRPVTEPSGHTMTERNDSKKQ